MSAAHTPGPWKAFHKNGKHIQAEKWSIDHEDAGSLSYAPIKAGSEVIAFAVSRSDRTMGAHNVAPNCHLIATAPELLAFAQFVLRGIASGSIKASPYMDVDPNAASLELKTVGSYAAEVISKATGQEGGAK